MKKKREGDDSRKKKKEGRKGLGKKKYLIPLITSVSVVGVTEEVMAKCKCEPVDDSASNYF